MSQKIAKIGLLLQTRSVSVAKLKGVHRRTVNESLKTGFRIPYGMTVSD
jgi:hypothetical protein